ncbi:MAG: adenylyl-sulfate kinase, partial [Betaproteobacteria bacterium]
MTGSVYWVTGLAGSGKSTMSRHLANWLREQGRSVLVLDGDELRAALGVTGLFGRGDRRGLASCYGRLCRMLASQGFDVVIATISLFHEVQRWNRAHLPGYVEIVLEVPLPELIARDRDGLYAGAVTGVSAMSDVAGVDQPVEWPEHP